jgi:hypothetical protein
MANVVASRGVFDNYLMFNVFLKYNPARATTKSNVTSAAGSGSHRLESMEKSTAGP